MSDGPSFRLHYDLIGEPESGVWCPDCALPSAWRADMTLTVEGMADTAFAVMTVAFCDCGWASREAVGR